MMKKNYLKKLISPIFSFFLAFPALSIAVDFGGNLGYSIGNADSENIDEVQFDINALEVGFLMDTARTGRVFQYRLAINYLRGGLDSESSRFSSGDYHGVRFHNAFGFRMFENHKIRIWAGPNFYFFTGSFELDNGGSGDITSFGAGGSLGATLKRRNIDIAFEIGLRVAPYTLEFERTNSEDRLRGNDGYLNVGLLF